MPPTVTLDRPTTHLAPTVLDIEASGLGRSSYPIEVGYVLPDGHAYCTLVQPEQDWTHWDDSAAALHRITRELLQERGLRAREVATLLNTQLAGQTVYSDGWANDFTWLNVLYEAAGMSPRFKLENLRSLLSDEEADQWHVVKAKIASERGTQRHRASSDARLIQLTLQRIRAG
uniref:Exonuclease domain-containing protein n=1 Tax=Curvibacter symbiont subsp. Hydra magnipapillata TaxID=667019 RepID=C9Y8T3_CURXX|nr:hypothetical protein Csp_A05340 [Curvibacter putative symbiont of Hydra magnipapillata]